MFDANRRDAPPTRAAAGDRPLRAPIETRAPRRSRFWIASRRTVTALALFGLLLEPLGAQTAPLTLRQAIDRALERYPTIDASKADREAAAAATGLARLAYWPRLDALIQLNRGTRNNAAGLLLPQSVLAPISGPAVAANDSDSIWGTAVGALASWEPFDFGQRRAQMDAANAALARADAGARRTRLEVAQQTAEAYLTLVAARQAVAASRAAVERAGVLVRAVEALVTAELRPGVEGSRARAEQAAAQSQLIESEQTVEIATAAFDQFVGRGASADLPQTVSLPPPGPSEVTKTIPDFARHPALEEQQAGIAEAQARLRGAERSGLPRVALQGTIFGRGSGATADGTLLAGSKGVGLELYNWAIGVTATIPVFDLMASHARRDIEAAKLRAEEHRRDEVAAGLERRLREADASLRGARRVAEHVPVLVEAARATHEQALARYRAGLSTIVEVADAQRLLTQAEIDAALAQLRVWRAHLAVVATRDSLDALLQAAGQ